MGTSEGELEFLRAYKANTTHKTIGGGRHEISCNKGLFSVTSSDYEIADSEAKHYFMQYWRDGEYT